MLFKQAILEGIAAGEVTVAFRRWQRAAVKAGGTLRTSVGALKFETVEPVTSADITGRDALRAGFASAEALKRDLGRDIDDGRRIYRIAFRRVGDDPRIELRSRPKLDATAIADLHRRLDRYDAAAAAPWTARFLMAIADCPGVRAADLAQRLLFDKDKFKINVRKLKDLGLTESLDVGYRLSPRGRALLAAMAEKPGRHR
jgi:hypothetical protein